MKILLSILLICAGSFVARPANAAFLSGTQLLSYCNVSERSRTFHQESAMCMAYIAGVVDGTNGLRGAFNLTDGFCLPAGVSIGQLQAVAHQYLRQNPAELHRDASLLVWTAMKQAFPCGQAK